MTNERVWSNRLILDANGKLNEFREWQLLHFRKRVKEALEDDFFMAAVLSPAQRDLAD